MRLLLGIIRMIYEFGFFPLAAGMLVCTKKEKPSIHKAYIMGMCILFSIFLFIAVPIIFTVNKLSVLTSVWTIMLILSLLVFIFLFWKKKKQIPDVIRCFYENIQYAKKKAGVSILFLILIFLISITFSMPSLKDDTPEVVNIAVETDTMYQYQPYTKIPYEGINKDKALAPIEMLYAVTCTMSGLDCLTVVHVLIPFFFIPFFYAVCWMAGRYFFEGNIKKIGMFTVFMVIFYTTGLSRETYLTIGILNNSWNGISLAVACGVPMVCIQMFRMSDCIASNGKTDLGEVIKLLLMASALQLMISKGYFLSIVILACSVFILLYKKGLRNAGVVKKRNK